MTALKDLVVHNIRLFAGVTKHSDVLLEQIDLMFVFFFFFPPINISAISTITASVCMQYVPIGLRGKTSTCVQKFTSQFHCNRHRSMQANGGDKSHVQINSSGEECAEHLKQCSPIQGCCLRATSSGVRALIWHCSFVCVWVPLAPVSRFCAVVGIWDGQKTGDWFNCPLGVRNKRCTAKWFGGAFC